MKHVYKNETDYFIGESCEHAMELCRTSYGCPNCEDGACDEENLFTLCDDAKPLTIENEDDGAKVTKTCGEWAASEPCGLLCSTEW